MTELLTTALFGSLLGSLHCVGMCGPFVVFYSEGPEVGHRVGRSHLLYNAGRLVGYLGLGVIAGLLGAVLERTGLWSGLQNTAAFAAAGFMVIYGAALLVRALWPTPAHIEIGPPSRASRALSSLLLRSKRAPAEHRALILGLGTGLLPCGWLYGFVALAGGTASPWLGAAVMAAFWLGTVPAMLGAGLGVRATARWLGPKLPILMPALVLSLGLISLAHRAVAAMNAPPNAPPACHHE